MDFEQEFKTEHDSLRVGAGVDVGAADKEQTACIVITDPPSGLEIGIDCMTYETGELKRILLRQRPSILHVCCRS